ncbi:hypothetical protein EPI10_021784 [Gossypium australe]|uniref:Uncharacterized protein n=1 Tax=Gossypium australe TaxID=47621 RepID=A0A5B6WJS2_9ROSI|nr:hypothetical protein EPI10_021784 [Gossypium australe]
MNSQKFGLGLWFKVCDLEFRVRDFIWDFVGALNAFLFLFLLTETNGFQLLASHFAAFNLSLSIVAECKNYINVGDSFKRDMRELQ